MNYAEHSVARAMVLDCVHTVSKYDSFSSDMQSWSLNTKLKRYHTNIQ